MKEQRIKIKWTTVGIFITQLVLMILTLILDSSKANWVCGPVLFYYELLCIAIQLMITIIGFKSNNRITKWILFILSCLILTSIIIGFINFQMNCS